MAEQMIFKRSEIKYMIDEGIFTGKIQICTAGTQTNVDL